MAQSKSNKIIIIIAAIGLSAMAGSLYMSKKIDEYNAKLTENLEAQSEEQLAEAASEGANEDAAENTAPEELSDLLNSSAGEGASFDLDAALTERIMGDPSAPIKISEHSSLTCGHCGNFHRTIFAQFKANYIDTGKVYLVFSDFPLNAPALHATKVSRCVPEENYFAFIEQLFAEQDQWAYEKNYAKFLRESAAKFGVDDALFDACINSKELEAGILARITAAQTQWDIRSTPSFVVNNQKTLSGASNYDAFAQGLESIIAELNSEDGGS